MLAQAFSMIRGDHDQRLLESARWQTGEQTPDDGVRVRDLRFVGLMLRRVRLGGAVRFVRIVEVNPREPGIRGSGFGIRRLRMYSAADPSECGLDDFLCPSFGA